MAIKYDGIIFEKVEELIEYKKAMGEMPEKQKEEIQQKELKELQPKEKTIPYPKIYKRKKINKINLPFSKEEDDLIKEYYNKYIVNKRISRKRLSILSRRLNRKNLSIICRYSKFLKDDIKDLDKSKENIEKTDNNIEKRKRTKFIEDRAKILCKIDNRLNYEKAREMALQEYEKGKYKVYPEKKSQITDDDLIFPTVYPLTEQGSKIFETMLIDLIARKPDGKIDYFAGRNNLDITPYTWDGRMWREFCQQMLFNSKKICTALNCDQRKLKVIKEQGKYDVIKYG